MSDYKQGNVATVRSAFTDGDTGNPVTPGAVHLTVLRPDGSVLHYENGVDPEINDEGLGVYTCDVDLDMAGLYKYRWWSTGTGQAADWADLSVAPTEAVGDGT